MNEIVNIRGLEVAYGPLVALRGINLSIPRRQITALIGPSGCGKSTLLRSINRMNEMISGARRLRGEIRVNGVEIHDAKVDPAELRRRVGMVFQKSSPFPRSVHENVAYGPRILGERRKRILDTVVEDALRKTGLWDEVKDRLHESALRLSGGQQQRLCIARSLAVEPEILLMDEPCASLDPIAAARVEELILGLRSRYTILIVTHNMQQAARVSDYTAFLDSGELIEFDSTEMIFSSPAKSRTEDYITGRFG